MVKKKIVLFCINLADIKCYNMTFNRNSIRLDERAFTIFYFGLLNKVKAFLIS